ncbi:alpha/beta fold hydrolase family protein [Deinococcus sp. KNUC1210]|uniref:homoserine O-acetyltransferase family protein n=1 Tax=Deinococcus sp. KNUC1210 TaxID=2917691 RepID=UPI001EEF9D6B|nr:alpha/beta fold hydrolase family protein [Deinococcus sp. KNUC1210]ULH16283.1 alpha/beta fold hydrolase family protein [Deinococcus sp. KNUC1210]
MTAYTLPESPSQRLSDEANPERCTPEQAAPRLQTITLFRDHPLLLDCGRPLSSVRVAYHTYGEAREDALLVTHALTGTSAVHEWWPTLFGPGKALDPRQSYIVCSNVLGGCAGTSGPAELDGTPLTLRDMVAVQRELLRVLGVRRVTVVGGSMGGMQVYEWLRSYPDLIERAVIIGAPARHSPWAIGLNTAQRNAIRLAPGGEGLKVARQIAMLSYRSPQSLGQTQAGESRRKPGVPAVETYLEYQGEKLAERFCEQSYCTLTEAMDRFSLSDAELSAIRTPVLVVGISSDVLYPCAEVQSFAELLPVSTYWELHSSHGHDAFLMDADTLNDTVKEYLTARLGA